MSSTVIVKSNLRMFFSKISIRGSDFQKFTSSSADRMTADLENSLRDTMIRFFQNRPLVHSCNFFIILTSFWGNRGLLELTITRMKALTPKSNELPMFWAFVSSFFEFGSAKPGVSTTFSSKWLTPKSLLGPLLLKKRVFTEKTDVVPAWSLWPTVKGPTKACVKFKVLYLSYSFNTFCNEIFHHEALSVKQSHNFSNNHF